MSKKKKAEALIAECNKKRSKAFHQPDGLPRSPWLDGESYLLERGVDFHMMSNPETFAKEIRREAALFGVKVSVTVLGSGNITVVSKSPITLETVEPQ